MASRSTSQAGNWNDTATWGGLSVPGSGDDATVGHAVAVTANQTVGTSGIAGTVAITLTTGTLTINAGVVLTVLGDISHQRGASVFVEAGGGVVSLPPSGVGYRWIMSATGSGTPRIEFRGTSGSRCTLASDLSASGTRCYFDWTAYPPDLSWAFLDITHWGGTGDTTATRAGTYVGVAGSVSDWFRVRCLTNVGKWHFTFSGGSWTFDIKESDFRSPLNSDWLQVVCDTAFVSGRRRISRSTFHHTSTTSIVVWAPDLLVDEESVLSNTRVIGDIQDDRTAIRKSVTMDDLSINGQIATNAGGLTVEDCVHLSNVDNPHYVATNSASAPAVFRRNVVDGFGFVGGDAGDYSLPTGPVLLSRILLINRAGSLFSVLNTTCRITVERCTLHGPGTFANCGESASAADTLARITSTLFVGQPAGLTYDTLTAQAGFRCDYNGFHDQTDAANIDHPGLSQNGYLESGTWWSAGAFGDDHKGQHDVYGDPAFANGSATAITWYDSIFGSGGSWANVRNELLKINGTDASGANATPNAAVSRAALWQYLFDSRRPTNPAYLRAGAPDDGRPDIGAADILALSRIVTPATKTRPAPFSPGLAR